MACLTGCSVKGCTEWFDPLNRAGNTMCDKCTEEAVNKSLESFVFDEKTQKFIDEILEKHRDLFERLAELEKLEKEQNDSSKKTDI